MIFVIGGKGFLGSAFGRALDAAGVEHAIVDRESYSRFAGKPCRVLINANGNSSKLLGKTDPLRDFDQSVRSVRSTLLDFSPELYVHCSSCDVYPDCSSPETTQEDQLVDVARQSPYGFHKFLAEECVRQAAPNWLIFRLGGLVGPGLKKNAIFDILNGGSLWLDPESELQYLHTDAAAAIVFQLIEQSAAWRQVFNLCGRGVVRLRDVIEQSGRNVTVQPGSPRVRYEVSTEKISHWVQLPDSKETVREFVRARSEAAG